MKLINVLIHLGSCYLLYKISRKKIFPLLYGLNPFILLEGIANVHNDIYVVFFVLLSLYELLNKKSLIKAILFLAIATAIKYFTIIFLPLYILYYYKDEKLLKKRFINCIKYGVLFLVFFIIPYFLFIKDLKVFDGFGAQRNRIAKGIYLILNQYVHKPANIVSIVKNYSLGLFALIYVLSFIKLLNTKKIKFYIEMRKLYLFMLAFIFLLITNFQPWYLMWLTPLMIWQKSINIKLINGMQIMALIANCVFLVHSEMYYFGVRFFAVFMLGTLTVFIANNLKKNFNIIKNKKEKA